MLTRSSEHRCKDLFDRISDYEPNRVYQSIKLEQCPGTARWFLECQNGHYTKWKEGSIRCLWLTGISAFELLVTTLADSV